MKNDELSIDELIASQKPGHSLDQRFYTDPAIYDLEIEKIVNRNWILAGHASQLPEPGDFKVLNVAQESAIIVRGKDGKLKGFANVCRHRGSLVCLEEEGHADKFTCPYHGWMYDIDGNLTAARNMKDDFDTFNRIYAEHFVSNRPCRTTVEVGALPTPIAVELKVIATNGPVQQCQNQRHTTRR